MTASLRGLVVLTVIAAVLGVVVVVDRPPGAAIEDRRLVPGLDPSAAVSIDLDGPGGRVALGQTATGWFETTPAPGPADAAAVDDLLGAVAAARWDRTVADAAPATTGLDRPALTVTIASARGLLGAILRFGRAVPGAEQVWAQLDDGPPRLVPAWVLHAASRTGAELRRSQLVRARPADVTGVELHGRGVDLVASGAPLAVHPPAGGAARLDRGVAERLLDALAALRASSFPAAAMPPADEPAAALSIRVLGGAATDELTERGPCDGHPDQARFGGTAGPVCVDAAALDRVVAAARAAAAGAAAIDPHPLDRRRLARLTWPGTGATVEVAGGSFRLTAPAAAAGPADDGAVRAAVAALAEPGRVVPLPARAHPGPRAPAGPSLVAAYADGGEDRLAVVAVPGTGVAVRRGDEPFAIVVAPPALAALGLGPGDLRDRALVVEEPTALTALVARAGARTARATRGAVVGEWQGELDPGRVAAAADVLARLRAERFLDRPDVGPVRLTLEATFAAPPVAGGAPSHHTVAIGAARPGGCAATVDGTAVLLATARCRTLLSLHP